MLILERYARRSDRNCKLRTRRCHESIGQGFRPFGQEKDNLQEEHEAAMAAAEQKWKVLMQARDDDKDELNKSAQAQDQVVCQ